MRAVPLAEVSDESAFGGKAVQLGAAARAGLAVPPGVALDATLVDAIAASHRQVTAELADSLRRVGQPVAVRSSAIGEDSAEASVAGKHQTILGVGSVEMLVEAVRSVWRSAGSEAALAYRQRLGLGGRPAVGVVVQALVDPEVAGVLFTRNPIDGADERVVEASWGLGEAVVAARVVPDRYRIARSGEVLERVPGYKDVAIRRGEDGGTYEEAVAPELVERLCLDDPKLEELSLLAGRCEEVFGQARDIEWALADGRLHLLQCRAVPRTGQA